MCSRIGGKMWDKYRPREIVRDRKKKRRWILSLVQTSRPQFSIVLDPWCLQPVVNPSAVFGINNQAWSMMPSCNPLHLQHTCSHTNPTPSPLTWPPFPYNSQCTYWSKVSITAAAGSQSGTAFIYTCLNLCGFSASYVVIRKGAA